MRELNSIEASSVVGASAIGNAEWSAGNTMIALSGDLHAVPPVANALYAQGVAMRNRGFANGGGGGGGPGEGGDPPPVQGGGRIKCDDQGCYVVG